MSTTTRNCSEMPSGSSRDAAPDGQCPGNGDDATRDSQAHMQATRMLAAQAMQELGKLMLLRELALSSTLASVSEYLDTCVAPEVITDEVAAHLALQRAAYIRSVQRIDTAASSRIVQLASQPPRVGRGLIGSLRRVVGGSGSGTYIYHGDTDRISPPLDDALTDDNWHQVDNSVHSLERQNRYLYEARERALRAFEKASDDYVRSVVQLV